MKLFDPRESIGFHCSITYRAFARALESALSGTGVSSAQFIALAHLRVFGPMPQSELAAYLSTSQVSVVKLIDRMEKNGWVERVASLKDRRVKLLVVTQKVEDIWEQATARIRSLLKKAYQGISPEKIEAVKNTLEQIRANLEV